MKGFLKSKAGIATIIVVSALAVSGAVFFGKKKLAKKKAVEAPKAEKASK